MVREVEVVDWELHHGLQLPPRLPDPLESLQLDRQDRRRPEGLEALLVVPVLLTLRTVDLIG